MVRRKLRDKRVAGSPQYLSTVGTEIIDGTWEQRSMIAADHRWHQSDMTASDQQKLQKVLPRRAEPLWTNTLRDNRDGGEEKRRKKTEGERERERRRKREKEKRKVKKGTKLSSSIMATCQSQG